MMPPTAFVCLPALDPIATDVGVQLAEHIIRSQQHEQLGQAEAEQLLLDRTQRMRNLTAVCAQADAALAQAQSRLCSMLDVPYQYVDGTQICVLSLK
jgi:hypothetical protein